VKAYSRNGKYLGSFNKSIVGQGNAQIFLNKEFLNLDEYGVFTVEFHTKPRFSKNIAYMGKLSPQFMTIYEPQDTISAPQMAHSHKIQQGAILLNRDIFRPSSHVEPTKNLQRIRIYSLNCCGSSLEHRIDVGSVNEEKVKKLLSATIPAYGVNLFELSNDELDQKFNRDTLNFRYYYNKNVDHKKPIFLRQFKSGTWTANHT
jgi:hypothetical protein